MLIYGFCTYTTPSKPKYLISLYRSEELNIIAVFSPSQRRAGVTVAKHGCNRRNDVPYSYVFEAGGQSPMFVVPSGAWHNSEALESGTVIFETKDGAYEPLGEEDVRNVCKKLL